VATAALFGERGGRVLVAVTPNSAPTVEAAAGAAGVRAQPLGVAKGHALSIALGEHRLALGLDQIVAAWTTPF
jgi:hypothetical protein